MDRGQPFLGRGDLDHDVGPVGAVAQVLGHRDGAFRVARQCRRDLDADEAVLAFGLVVDGPEDVSRGLDVLDHQSPQHLRRRRLLFDQADHRLVVVGRPADRLLEDGRVGGDAGQALVAQAGELAGGDQLAADVVEPQRLADPRLSSLNAVVFGLCSSPSPYFAWSSLVAAATMCRAEMPAAFISSSGLPEVGRPFTARCAMRGAVRRERFHHGGAEAALGVVVLDDDELSLGGFHRLAQRLHVDRLDRVEVDHPGRDLLRRQLVGGGEAVVQRHAGADERDLVLGALAHDLGAADLEGLVGPVDGRVGAARRAHVDDAGGVGHHAHELGRLVGVAWVEHCRAVDRAHRGQVLERHLRRPVLADLDACVRADQPDVGLRDARHADEVVGAAEEGGEGRRERLVAAHAHPHRGRHQLLLGDPHLEEPIGVRLGELVGVSRVRDLAVHGDDLGHRAQGDQGIAVGLARGDLVVLLVDRQRDHRLGHDPLRRARGRLGLGGLDLEVADPAELLDRALGHVRRQRLAVPAVLVLDLGEALALDRLGDDHRRLAGRGEGLSVGAVDRRHVVAVDHDREAAERLHAPAVHVQGPAVLGLAALAEPVDVEDRGEVGQLVVPRLVEGLPDRALGQLGVAAQRPDVVGELVEVLARQRDADRDR